MGACRRAARFPQDVDARRGMQTDSTNIAAWAYGGKLQCLNMPLKYVRQFARKHAARLGVRTLPSLHVASALELNAEQFWTFDDRQKKLAQAAGLRIV
jgi:hypothetical protein